MSVSESLLAAIAIRLAFLVLLGLAARTLPPQPRIAAPPIRSVAAESQPTGSPSWNERARTSEVIRDMLNRD